MALFGNKDSGSAQGNASLYAMLASSSSIGQAVAAERTKPVVPPHPEGEDVTSPIGDTEYIAYKRTCETIGFEPTALIEAEILAFMAEKKMKRYDNAKVGAFLTAKAKQLSEYHYWQWVPLRAKDAPAVSAPTQSQFGMLGQMFASAGPTDVSYQKAIPLRVLARVEQFIQKFGNKVRFMVSDYAERRPDPFIAVMPKTGGTEAIIFDVWDEPDFR
jgi:hypothetical protein